MNYLVQNKAFGRNICAHIAANISNDKIYEISVNEFEKSKTYPQVKYIWSIFGAMSKYFINYGNEFFTPEIIKEWMYDELGITQEAFLPITKKHPKGRKIIIRTSISSMNIKEASEFINKLLFFVDESEYLEGFVLPPYLRYCWTNHIDYSSIENVYQDNNWWVAHEKDKEFLGYQAQQTCIRCGRKGVQVHHVQHNSGYAQKNPDWFTLPVCPECHIQYLHSLVSEQNFLKEISHTIGNLQIEDFCRLNYYRWFWHIFMNTTEQKAMTLRMAENFK